MIRGSLHLIQGTFSNGVFLVKSLDEEKQTNYKTIEKISIKLLIRAIYLRGVVIYTFYFTHFFIHGICVADLCHFYSHEGNEGSLASVSAAVCPFPLHSYMSQSFLI